MRITIDDLKQAMERDELVFHYQPKVSLVTGRVNGAEALLRWRKPDGGLRPPGDFLPMAEASGFITTLTRHMFPKLLADMRLANDAAGHLPFAFNISPKDLEAGGFTRDVLQAIDDRELDPQQLHLELVESSVLESATVAPRNLRHLADAGVELFMDDFATGFSSIDVLSLWPFQGVKIDQGLVRRMRSSEKATVIVNSSIHMAHQLDLGVVAEGVETAAIYRALLHAGCQEAQGFWLGRPMPLGDYIGLIRENPRWLGHPSGLIHMAQLDHIRWRKDLVECVVALAFGTAHNRGEWSELHAPELNHTQCMLGRWFYGAGREFADHRAYEALERAHRNLHDMGAELYNAALENNDREWLVDAMRKLSHQSGIVLHLLHELETEAVLRYEHSDHPDSGWVNEPGGS